MAKQTKKKKNPTEMFLPAQCGWMNDVKSNKWFFYLPAESLEDIAYLEILLEELHDIDPRNSNDIEHIH